MAFLGVLALALGSAAASAQSEPDLPDIGNPAGALVTSDDTYGISLMMLRQLRAQGAILDDPESTEYIQSLGARISSQASEQPHPIQYVVLRSNEINSTAFGDIVFMWTGLIIATDNESELAGVMSHETAHVTQHHFARGIYAQSHQSLETAAEMLAAVLIGAVAGGNSGPDVIEGGIAAAQGLAAQRQINFTRTQEWEADRIGMQYLSKAGFSPYGMADFFQKMQLSYGYEEDLFPKFLSDHPITTDRIAEARARASQMPQPVNLKESVDYGLIRERLRVLTADDTYDILGYYRKRMQSDTPSLADQYGYAVALIKRGNPAEAVRLLEPLIERHQGVILLRIALAQAQVAAGHMRRGLATFAEGERLFPRNVPLTVRYAEALIKADRGKEAHELLLDLFNNVDPTPMQIKLTAQAASAAGDPGDAYYYMGEYQIANGNLPLAAHQYQLALAAPRLTNVQRERYRARLAEVRDFLAQEARAHHGRQQQTSDGGFGFSPP
ncbi:MAG: M48 family metalloprotease [Steroidobacteraceae bacterium]